MAQPMSGNESWSAVASGCLSENDVLSLVRGTLAERGRAGARRHIDGCAACQDLLACIVQTAPDALGSGARLKSKMAYPPAGGLAAIAWWTSSGRGRWGSSISPTIRSSIAG